MRLYEFIEGNMEPILQAWEDFARSVETQQPNLDATGLRNHAEKILHTVAQDMRTTQTAHQQSEKRKEGAANIQRDSGPDTCGGTSDGRLLHGSDGLRISSAALQCALPLA